MSGQIYLRMIQDDKEAYVVDQDGRRVDGVVSIVSEHSVDDVSFVTLKVMQRKDAKTFMSNGMFKS